MNITRTADEFTSDEYVYITDESSLDSIYEYFPTLPEDFTAAFVIVADGDYSEVWVTEASKHWLTSTVYERII